MRESDQKFRDAAPLSVDPTEAELAVGMMPLAEYLKEFGIEYSPPK